MPTMQIEVFEAIPVHRHTGGKAMKAAGALAKRDDDVVDIKWDLAVLTWMIGTLYPLVIAILFKLFLR